MKNLIPDKKPLPIFENGYSVFKKPRERDFKILLLTDTHFGCGFLSRKSDRAAEAAIRVLAGRAAADLIIISGDLCYPIAVSSGTNNNKKQAEHVSAVMESLTTPWAFVFGNHDQERHSPCKKDALADIFMRGKNCLFKKGPENIDGVGNYIIKIENSDKTLNNALFLLDSNMYLKKGFFSGYDHIHDNQIDWYKSEVARLTAEYGENPSSMMFFHIPIKEFYDAWRLCYLGSNEVTYHLGFANEKDNYVGFPKSRPTHLFDDIVTLGSTKAVFAGHDHLNNFSITYKGIRLSYPMSIDYLAYRKIAQKHTQRGGTLVTLCDDGGFDIRHLPLEENISLAKY